MKDKGNLTRLNKFSGKDVKEIFTMIYDTFDWGSKTTESVSGTGSTLKHTKNLRSKLPKICKKYKIEKILDAACGDFNWMKEIVSNFSYYKGTDIVDNLIKENLKLYGIPNKIEFECLNIIDELGNDSKFDAVILKDILVHLTNSDIQKIINNLKSSGIKYVFITNFNKISENIDIHIAGQWRPLNLSLEPFNLGNPIEIIKERSESYKWFNENKEPTKMNDKTLSLWKIQ